MRIAARSSGAGARQPAEPQVFDVLVHLATHRDRVVGKDELVDVIWQGRIVSDATLASRINAARRVIGDSGEAQFLIRTYPRRGFRFVGDVEVDSEGTASAEAEPRTADFGSVERCQEVSLLPGAPTARAWRSPFPATVS